MAQRHIYLRDYTLNHKPPFGCLMMEINKDKGEIRYAFSVCSPQDTFNSKIAIDVAKGRLTKGGNIIKTIALNSSHDITRSIMQHIVDNNKSQSNEESRSHRAYLGALSWLQKTNKYDLNKESRIAALVNALV